MFFHNPEKIMVYLKILAYHQSFPIKWYVEKIRVQLKMLECHYSILEIRETDAEVDDKNNSQQQKDNPYKSINWRTWTTLIIKTKRINRYNEKIPKNDSDYFPILKKKDHIVIQAKPSG